MFVYSLLSQIIHRLKKPSNVTEHYQTANKGFLVVFVVAIVIKKTAVLFSYNL